MKPATTHARRSKQINFRALLEKKEFWRDGDRAQEARGPQPASGTCCLRTFPTRRTQVFFGDFLSPDKKSPIVRRTAEAAKAKLDSGLRRNDEPKQISAFRDRRVIALNRPGINLPRPPDL